jgi:serine/threonine-protein kinase mTOR
LYSVQQKHPSRLPTHVVLRNWQFVIKECVLQSALTGEGKLEADGVRGMPGEQPLAQALVKGAVADSLLDPLPSVGLMTHSDDFYPKVAINALLKQLRDLKMAPQHSEVVTALMYIFKDLKLGSVQYLSSALPVLFSVVRSSEEGLQQFVCRQLVDLVRVVQGHMRKYLPDFLELIKEFWDLQRPALLKLQLQLLAWLARALQEDMRLHVGSLVPKFTALFQDAERSGNYSVMEPGLMVRLGCILP